MASSTRQEDTHVKVGQVWIDCDRRTRGRRLEVINIVDGAAMVKCLDSGRHSRIKLRRFQEGANGYRLETPPARDTDLLEPQRDRREW